MHTPRHTLLISLNWIGDVIMSLPAVQAYRAAYPDERLTVLAKPSVRPLWELHEAPDELICSDAGRGGLRRTVRRLREAGPMDRALVMPNSFRSALLPWLARIPERIGYAGHSRRALLTSVVSFADSDSSRHQVYETATLLGVSDNLPPCPLPRLKVSGAVSDTRETEGSKGGRPRVVLVPGAARGPAKQWPEDRFVELGRRLCAEQQAEIVVTGSPVEQGLCDAVAEAIGDGAGSVAGRIDLRDWLALLAAVDLVVANDSGAMHVAAAMNTPVVALYGITDPAVTGPLTTRATILQHGTERHRDVPRDCATARAALAAIDVDEVYQAARSWLGAVVGPEEDEDHD